VERWPIGMIACALFARTAAAEGVCVSIDVSRDNLSEQDRNGFRIAILDALKAEGIPVDPDGLACRGVVVAYSMKLGNSVTTTITAGTKSVNGRASNLDELDLSVRQLVRSLVTGASLATGFGVTDRQNVLRDQTAPRRVDARSSRRWDPVIAIGGGVLQLPAIEGRPRQRQNDVISIEAREWGFMTSDRSAVELYARILIHDYAAFGTVKDEYDDARSNSMDHADGGDLGAGAGIVFSPFVTANYDAGFGLVHFIGDSTPRPFVRAGGAASLLLRISDPDHRIDLGLGGYAGFGFQLTKQVNVSVAVNMSNPVFHSFAGEGYWYFATATAMLEFRGEGREHTTQALLGPEPDVPTIRVIHD
jgi:hypothetical protein